MNREHTVKVETLVSLGVFLRHQIFFFFEKLQILLLINIIHIQMTGLWNVHCFLIFSLCYMLDGGKRNGIFIASLLSFPYSLSLCFLPLKPLFISFVNRDKKFNVRSITSSHLLYYLAKVRNGQIPTFFPENHMLKTKWHNALSGYCRKHMQQST